MSGIRRSSAFGAIPAMLREKPKIDIKLEDQQAGCFVPSYTTLDRIQGKATVICPNDTCYDAVHVIFQGAAKTFVEKIASSSPTMPRTHAYHNFLRLVQPMDEVALPEDKVLRAGVTYTIPFTFVVPERLLPQACTHGVENSNVQDAHLIPPPSLGDPMMAGDGKSLLDDLAPPMTMVSYGIRVIVTRRDVSGSTQKLRSVADAMKKLRIIPVTEEQPPLTVQEGVDDYYLRRCKPLKKGMFKGKVGTLTVSAQQPPPLRLPFIRTNSPDPCATTTMAAVDLLFEPRTPGAKPPRLGQLWVKLKCATFYATAPLQDFPSRSQPFTYDPQRGLFVETIPLSSRRVESVQWTKQEGLARRDSGISVPTEPQKTPFSARPTNSPRSPRSPSRTSPRSPSSPASPGAERTNSVTSITDDLPPPPEGVHYTARILVPIDLPTSSKTFVPTFHTCLISRIYALDLAVSAHGGSKAVSGFGSTSTLHLKVPLQIVQEGSAEAVPVMSPGEAAHIRHREEAAGAMERRASALSQEGNDLSSGMADLTLRGARGSVFVPPRWGSVSWGDGTQASQGRRCGGNSRFSSPRLNGASSGGSDEEIMDEEETTETRREMMDALEDEAQEVHREHERERDEPPGYTAFNGIASRGRGANMWT